MVYFLPMSLLLLTGWLIKYKKATWLISGYNTASYEKKQQYDIEKLCKHMGNFLFVLASIFFSMAIISVLIGKYSSLIAVIGICVLAVAVVCGIIYLNTGNRVKKE